LTAAVLLYGGAYFLYDGFVRYPHQNEIFNGYAEIKAKYTSPETREAQWQQVARERGWPVEFSGEYPGMQHSSTDMWTQRVIGLICTPLGLLLLVNMVRHIGRWVELDETKLRSSWGQEAAMDQIRRLNKARWKTKGIAVAEYVEGGGRERRLVLDDWKYDRQATADIVRELEGRLGPDKVSGEVVGAGAA
jgi:hypothetical protein